MNSAHCGPIKRMARGGMIQGPGTGTSDSIPAEAPVGTFIQPADTTRDIRVSNGESAFTPQDQQLIGAVVMELMRSLTHRSAGEGGKGPFSEAKGFNNGGQVTPPPQLGGMAGKAQRVLSGRAKQLEEQERQATGMADGGMVTEEERRRAAQPGLFARAASAIMPGTRATLAGSGEDIASSARAGNYAQAAGHALRGAAALPVALADDVIGQPLRQIGLPTANAATEAAVTAATGAPPMRTAPPAARATPNPTDQRLAAGTQAAPVQPAAPAPSTGTLLAGADGVYKLQEGGRTLYTDNPDATMPSAAQPSARSVAAADALDARYRAESGPFSRAAAGAAPVETPAQAQVFTARPFGFRLASEEQAPAFDSRGMSQRQIANLQVQLANAREGSATSRGNAELSAEVARAGQGVQAATAAGQLALGQQRLAQDAPVRQAQAAEATARAGLSIRGLAARAAYDRAVASGDPKAIAAAERTLRAYEGKDTQPRYSVVPGGQTTNEFGQAITQPSMVFDQQSQQFIRPPAAGGQPSLPPGMTRQVGTSGGKPVYEDANGNRFIGD